MLFQAFLLSFLVSFSVLILFYFSYFLVLYYYHRKKENVEVFSDTFPNVSLIVPVYNEEKIISKKIENIIKLNYPKAQMEAIFVDGCSTDKTIEIIENYSKSHNSLIRLIIERNRAGYNSAICEGVLRSHGDIIVMSDSGAYYDEDTLKNLVGHFVDPKIGAVTGKEIVLGDKQALGPRLEATYRKFYDFMRIAETRMDSTPDSKGEILAVRRDICKSLTQRIHFSPSASFDCCIPYQAKLEEYRTIFDPKATYYEYAPSGFIDRMRQQIRRGAVLVGSQMLFRNIMMNKKYGKFGLVIAPVHFIMQVILPWLFVLGSISLLIATMMNPTNTFVIWATLLLLTFLVSLKNRTLLLSFVQSQLALVIATLRVVTRRNSVIIDTIPSTRK